MTPRIYLFDIDGTLLDADGAGRRALERSFEIRFGRPDAFERVDFAGRSDRAIVRSGLHAIGRSPDDVDLDAAMAHYVEVLEEEMPRSPGARVLPGVVELLEVLRTRPDGAIGLGTGNFEGGARIKLGHLGLLEWFSFGGYGSDHEDRTEILRLAARRGAEWLHRPLESCEVIVIGDTPRDITAAHAIGATVLAVATGPFDPGPLRDAGARLLFESLAADGVHEALLGSD